MNRRVTTQGRQVTWERRQARRAKTYGDALIRLEEQFRAHVEKEEGWHTEMAGQLGTLISTLTPIVTTNTTILRGVPGTENKGMVGDVNDLKTYVRKDEKRWARVMGAAAIVSGVISAAFREFFK